MIFSSMTFLFAFMPLLLILYFVLPKRCTALKNAVLLIFSLVFYGWGEPRNVVLILVCVLFTYLFSFGVAKKSKLFTLLASLVNLLPLILYKYADFAIANLNSAGLALTPLGLTLPIGISFYTFQVLTYVIDLYRGKVQLQKNPAYLALYVFFFPQLIAGPIVRYSDVEREIRERSVTWTDAGEGARRFIIGFAKKMLIANQAGFIVTTLLQQGVDRLGTGMLWIAVLSYGVQIYFDFSGYSDMAIGLGRIFGFHFLENFNKPYTSRSITEFWRRWHISLSTFFRDYVYIPLGGSRVKPLRHVFNMFVVWFLTGLWHGAFWNYAMWGVYYFILLVLEKYVYGKLLEKLPALISRAVTFVLFMVGWAIFMYESNSPIEILGYISRLFVITPTAAGVSLRALALTGNALAAGLGLFISVFDVSAPLLALKARYKRGATVIEYVLLLALFVFSIMTLIGESFNPFIYFRF